MIGPIHHFTADVFRAIITTKYGGLATPLDHLFKGTYYALTWEKPINIKREAFTIVVAYNIERP